MYYLEPLAIIFSMIQLKEKIDWQCPNIRSISADIDLMFI